ncbi:MAG: efflux RND transporter permease subunit [Polyangiales bacterium]
MTSGENSRHGELVSPIWNTFLGFFVDNKLIVSLLVAGIIAGGVYVSPFDWELGGAARDPVPVDAIPDIGENQQIVFTEWAGRSPRDVEDQVSYPLTTALLGIPGVRTVRSSSMFGFSTIYVIFEDGVEFYWSRSRILEKLSSLPTGTLPDGVAPSLGPDATALGQVFWYTLEGRGPDGELLGGWDLHELRSIQDWVVRFALQAVPGVSEVSSVGGYVREYQVDVDPEAMLASGVTIEQIARSVRESNLDVGARTLEINRAEYLVRGLGFIRSVADLEQTVIATRKHTPIRIADVARVSLGPAQRRGALDDAGAEAVGGVVVVRYGENPLEVIERVKAKIAQIAPGLPKRTLEEGTTSQVSIHPFYDRTTLIHETLDTLSTALFQQVLVTVFIVLVMLRHLRSSLLISAVLPLAVLAAFIAMKLTGVDANIMALAGIAIAIGTMVDMGIVFTENIVTHLEQAAPDDNRARIITRASAEVAPAVVTSTLTTVVSFLPVFALSAAEGKLFRPVAYTKSFAIVAALLVSMLVLPALAHLLMRRPDRKRDRPGRRSWRDEIPRLLLLSAIGLLLTHDWRPLGAGEPFITNLVFVALTVGVLLFAFFAFQRVYVPLLRWSLRHKALSLALPVAVLIAGVGAWAGLGREFMPPFDEGSFLYMPTTMPHASFGQSLEMLHTMDAAIQAIPEVDRAVGKLGRAESPLDPAPISMFETLVTYKPEFGVDQNGDRVRNWRDHIRSPEDIWDEIVEVAAAPGLTSAPMLMPINTRIIMLPSGRRAPIGIMVYGPDLDTIEAFGMKLEEILRNLEGVRPETVFADRVVGKPYVEIDIDREAIGRYGLTIRRVQEVIQVALGGQTLTRTVEGRERYPVRARYMREERGSIEALGRVLVSAPGGEQIPLEQLAEIRYVKGPQVIKSEDTFLTSYVLFDKRPELSEVEIVENARALLSTKIERGELQVPAGVSYRFAGTYENQVRSEQRLVLLIPVALALVFLLLYLQFRRVVTTIIIYSGVAVCVAGGFILIWLYGRPWFLGFELFGTDMQHLFHVDTINLSVAVWVGVIALLGIATDTGVVMATYLSQRFRAAPPSSIEDVRARTIEASQRRVRPCLMATATTALALLPVITSQGRGADVMVPMALPSVGGMGAILLTLFVVPVLYSWVEERQFSHRRPKRQRSLQ